jgi:vancomycin resistance protein VanW
MALHSPLEVVEHHHHGFDPFPDAGRVLPFGSGATIFYNYGDLRLSNPTRQPIQLSLRVGRRRLHGAIGSDRSWPFAYHVEELGHRFTRAADGQVYRDNELWRRVVDRRTGNTVLTSRIGVNHALVAYAVDDALVEPRDTSTTRSTAASLAADGGLRARRPAP